VGAWGAGIFSDDTAADVREEYRTCLQDGLSGIEATNRVLVEFQSAVDDVDAAFPLWLFLDSFFVAGVLARRRRRFWKWAVHSRVADKRRRHLRFRAWISDTNSSGP
jgi:hypothetical protein